MNLIEQLGGYEKTKEALIAEQRSKNIDPVIYINGDEVLIDAIDDALLQYRRQHNIFEVGEKVVLNTGSRIYKIDHIYKKAVWLDSGKDQLDVVNIDDIIRHATDAEIEAGKRLSTTRG